MTTDRHRLLDQLIRALPAWQVRAIRFNDAVAQRLGIAASDLHCLFVLDRSGPSSPGVIARSIGLTTGSASRMVERLLAAGLVSREPDPTDRRRAIVRIRPTASAQLHELYDPLDDRLRDLLERMDDETLDQLLRFVDAAESTTAELEPR